MPLLCGQPRLDCKAARFAALGDQEPRNVRGKLGSFQKATALRRATRTRQNAAAAWDCTPTRLCWFNASLSCAGTPTSHGPPSVLASQVVRCASAEASADLPPRARLPGAMASISSCRPRWSCRRWPVRSSLRCCAPPVWARPRALVLPRWSTGVLGRLPEAGAAWSVGAVGTEDGGVYQESVRFSSGRPTPKLTISVQTGCKSCLRGIPSLRSSSHGRGGACAGWRARDGVLEEESELLL